MLDIKLRTSNQSGKIFNPDIDLDFLLQLVSNGGGVVIAVGRHRRSLLVVLRFNGSGPVGGKLQIMEKFSIPGRSRAFAYTNRFFSPDSMKEVACTK